MTVWPRTDLRAPLVLALLFAGTGCHRTILLGRVHAPVTLSPTGTFRAGAARVDITPPPGYAMGGHSLAGEVSRGVWTRLHARAIFLEDGRGTRLVLVACDLWAFPSGLGERVLEKLATLPTPLFLGREEVVFAATHTHQSPGNFSTSGFYNEMASAWPGFDPGLFEFLADRIATAIDDAANQRSPAVLGFAQVPVSGLARNRSLEAFLLNDSAEDLLRLNPEGDLPERAVRRWVDVLVVKERGGEGEPLATLAFTSVHATAMHHSARFYTSDLFGVAARRLEADPASYGPVVAIFNGADGDASPQWIKDKQDRADTLRLGDALASAITTAVGNMEWLEEPVFSHGFRVAPIAGTVVQRDPSLRTSSQALAGVATIGGAEDGRFVLHDMGWKEGVTGPISQKLDRPEHGHKQPALDPPFLPLPPLVTWFFSTKSLMKKRDVPQTVPLGAHQIRDRAGRSVTLVTIPGEATYALGESIRDSVREGAASGNDAVTSKSHVVLVGLANEYLSYFTTPAEYEAQHYEGASTLYGAQAGTVLTEAIEANAATLGGYAGQRPTAYRYDVGGRHPVQYGLQSLGSLPAVPDLLAKLVGRAENQQLPGLPTACWSDRAVLLPAPPEAPPERVWPAIRIGSATDPRVTDDQGLELVTFVSRVERDRVLWCTTWLGGSAVDARDYRLLVDRVEGERLRCELATDEAARLAHLHPCTTLDTTAAPSP